MNYYYYYWFTVWHKAQHIRVQLVQELTIRVDYMHQLFAFCEYVGKIL